jgi:hypothetical protein
MADVANMTVIQSGKAKAPTNGAKANGAALAEKCIKYGEARMKAEEKEANKLQLIVKSIQQLEREGHAEFRATLTSEIQLIKELRKSQGVTREMTKGYSFDSFETLCSNWKTISTAVEMGYSIFTDDGAQKPWSLTLAESVQYKHAKATAADPNGVAGPTKKKVGRKATPLIEKALNAMDALETGEDLLKLYNALEARMQAMGIIG